MKHPRQPIELDVHGTARFKKNAIVCFLLGNGPFDMNALSLLDFNDEDRAQFAQLIGYSISGFGDLNYVSDEAFNLADNEVKKLYPDT